MGLAGLRHAADVAALTEAALAPATVRAYDAVWRQLRGFLQLPPTAAIFPVSVAATADFLASRHAQGCHSATLAGAASAIAYGHKRAGLPDPTADFRVRQLLAGSRRLRSGSDVRLPLSLRDIELLCGALAGLQLSPIERAAYRAIFPLAFFALLRPGEVVSGRSQGHTLRLGGVRVIGSQLSITIPSSKTSAAPHVISLVARPNISVCPVAALCTYLSLRSAGRPQDPLFICDRQRPITAPALTRVLRLAGRAAGFDVARLSGHCLRIGGTSHGASVGMSKLQLCQAGRWSSRAVRRYVRQPTSVLQAT